MLSDPQFWVFVAFIVFIATIFNPVRKILISNLDNKINEIKNSIDKAEELKSESQKTISEIKKRENQITNELKILEEETINKIKLYEENATKKINEQINKKKEIAKNRIDQITREANKEIQYYISETALASTINILEKKLNIKEKENLVNKSIDEINLALKN